MNLHKYFRGHLWLLSPSLGNTILYLWVWYQRLKPSSSSQASERIAVRTQQGVKIWVPQLHLRGLFSVGHGGI